MGKTDSCSFYIFAYFFSAQNLNTATKTIDITSKDTNLTTDLFLNFIDKMKGSSNNDDNKTPRTQQSGTWLINEINDKGF